MRSKPGKSVPGSSTSYAGPWGEEPGSAHLAIKSNSHDFGVYFSIVCYFDDQDEEAQLYAYRCEGQAPTRWDHVVSANQPPRVCASCLEAAVEEGAPDDLESMTLVMVEMGADVADHLCDAREAPNDAAPCLCACQRRR